jgi:hypothetical protein
MGCYSTTMNKIILAKEATYFQQMYTIRKQVFRFFQDKGWEPMRRGRHAHVSMFGNVREFQGILDIEMKKLAWQDMPDELAPNTPFTLWCAASWETSLDRMHLDTELYWQTVFIQLPSVVDMFLPRAWNMLWNLTPANALETWPGPSEPPDQPPHFGKPRIRRSKPLLPDP